MLSLRRHYYGQSVVETIGWILVGMVLAFIILDWNYFAAFLPRSSSPIAMIEYAESQQKQATINNLSIPELHLQAPIIYATDITEHVIEQALAMGVVHYPGTALPGTSGNVYIFGHSSDFLWAHGNFKNVFARLPQLPLGSSILVTDATGKTYTYIVIEAKVVSARDITVLNQDTGNKKILTLQTSYPLGTALKRYVVVAELQQ